jgi:hypothetical protein
VPAEGNINLLQDPSDYQITLVDVKSSYNKDTGMFTISGLRRGMLDIIPWSSASTAAESPKTPRVDIDLTLSDSDDARVLGKPPQSTKRKIADEDIPEVAVSEKRQKVNAEPSIEVETATAMSTEVPLSPMVLTGSMKVDQASQGSPLEERKFPRDLVSDSLASRQELPSGIHNMDDHTRPNAKRHLDEVATVTNDLEVSKGTFNNQRLGGLHSALGSVSSWAMGSVHALKAVPSEQTANSLHTREGISNTQANFQNLSPQRYEQRQSTVGSSNFSQAMEAEPKAPTITVVRPEPDVLGDGVKMEPGSTSDSPIILDDSDEPARTMAAHTHQAAHEERTAAKQVLNPNDTRITLEQQEFEKLPISGGQQMVYGDRPILGEQIALHVKPGPPNNQAKPEEKVAALTTHGVLEGRCVPEKQTGFEEEDVVFIEQRTIEGRTSTSKDSILEEGHMSKEGAEASMEQGIAVEPTITEVHPIALVGPEITREQPTRTEQNVTPIIGEILSEPASIHNSQAVFGERAMVSSVPGAPHKGERISTVLSGRTIPNGRAVSNKGSMFLGMKTNLAKRGSLSEQPIVIDALVTPYERRIPNIEAVEPDEQVDQATQGDAAVLDEQAISNDGTLASGRITHGGVAALEVKAISDGKAMSFGHQVIPKEEIVIFDEQDIPDKEAVIINEKVISDQEPNTGKETSPDAHVIPAKKITSSKPPDLSEQTPQVTSSRNGMETAATDPMGASIHDGNVFTHSPWRRGFSGDSAASQREQLEPPNVSKECPVCKEKFRDMSIPVCYYLPLH